MRPRNSLASSPVAWLHLFVLLLNRKLPLALMQGALGGSANIANPDGNLRSIYYARYVDWFFTTPLILLDVILMGNVALGATLW